MVTKIIMQGKLQTETYEYTSNWGVADFRYDVLLGMPRHVQTKPELDYSLKIFMVNGTSLVSRHGRSWTYSGLQPGGEEIQVPVPQTRVSQGTNGIKYCPDQ